MGFNGLSAIVDSYELGKTSYFTWRKAPSQATTIGIWFDLSMSPGNPVPNYYASTPLVAATLAGTDGIYHGVGVSPATMHIQKLTILSNTATALPMPMILCDYLLYYPFIDQGTNDIQAMNNSVTLPRYTDGKGVQILAVQVAAQATFGQTFYVTYTNQDGVTGRVTQTVTCNSSTLTGQIITSDRAVAGCYSPFLPLQKGDSGVRAIESLTMVGSDVGLICLVLVKPLASIMLRGIDAPVEVDFLINRPSMPQIYDGAYLNWLALPAGALNATKLHGDFTYIWS